MPKNHSTRSRRASAPNKVTIMPKRAAPEAANLFDTEVGRAVMAHFDDQMFEFAIEETELGKLARLALRLKRDNAPKKEIERAVKPFMSAYMKVLTSPASKLDQDGQGNFASPVALPRKVSPEEKLARRPRKEVAHA